MLRFEPDTTHADWFARDVDDWQELVLAGPRGYPADVRVPPSAADDIAERTVWALLRPHLRAHTTTPGDCFHALWEGANGVAAGDEPGFADVVRHGPMVDVVDEEGNQVRRYRLFRGSVDDVGRWGTADPATGASKDDTLPPPHLLWPADRAWFVASDVDADDTWITGPDDLVDTILADPALSAVRPGSRLDR